MNQINKFIKDNYQNLSDSEIAEALPGLTPKAVKGRRHRMNLMKTPSSKTTEILSELGANLEEIGKVEKYTVSNRRTTTKKEGEPEQVSNLVTTNIIVSPAWADGPEWDPISQAPLIEIKTQKIAKSSRDLNLAALLPDPQIGYRVHPVTGELLPFHDEAAMEVCLQYIRKEQPDLIVNLGDFLDLAAFGKFIQEPGFALTTQAAIDRGSRFLAEQRAAAPNAKIILLEGNHDQRLIKFLMANAKAAFGLKQANSEPEAWPVLSVPFLLRTDELDVEYIEGYPGNEYFINEKVKCIHGNRIGQNASKKAAQDHPAVSVIQGHNHHIEVQYETVIDHNREAKVRFSAILGCLCRTDGAVPSSHSSVNSSGIPTKYQENWQQCIGVLHYSDDGEAYLNPVSIHNGVAVINGEKFQA